MSILISLSTPVLCASVQLKFHHVGRLLRGRKACQPPVKLNEALEAAKGENGEGNKGFKVRGKPFGGRFDDGTRQKTEQYGFGGKIT